MNGGNLASTAIVWIVLGLLASSVQPQTEFVVGLSWFCYIAALASVIGGIAIYLHNRKS